MSQEASESPVTSMLADVAETLKKSPELVKARLKDTLVEREVAKRVEDLDKALNKVREARKELQKVKPDHITFDSATGAKTEGFTKDAFDKKKKAEEDLAKLEKAVETALNGEGFDKLRDLIK